MHVMSHGISDWPVLSVNIFLCHIFIRLTNPIHNGKWQVKYLVSLVKDLLYSQNNSTHHLQTPLALVSVILEKAVKKTQSTYRSDKPSQLSIPYVLFWCYGFNFLAHLMLFWVDLIPGFGMTDNMVDFGKRWVWWNDQLILIQPWRNEVDKTLFFRERSNCKIFCLYSSVLQLLLSFFRHNWKFFKKSTSIDE